MDHAIDREPGLDAVDLSACYRCGRHLARGWAFMLKAGPTVARQEIGYRAGEAARCILCALRHRPMLRRSLKVAAVVGTILTLLNQGDVIFAGGWGSALYWKVPLTYCVPFCVATFGSLANSQRRALRSGQSPQLRDLRSPICRWPAVSDTRGASCVEGPL